MRRALLALLVLSVIGLTAAVAGSFSANTEDVASFTTDVSLTVPTTDLPPVLYVRGGGDGVVGSIDLVPPTKRDSVTRQLVVLATDTVEAQADPQSYVLWRSPPAPAGGYVLRGSVSLFIEQKTDGHDDRITAGLLSCPPSAPAGSAECDTIVVAVADPAEDTQGFKERVVRFGFVDWTVPAGRELRLKIVNRQEQPDGTPVSGGDWDLQWGYLPSRQSRVEIAPP